MARRFRVTVHRIDFYEVEGECPISAGRSALEASLSDPGPHGGFVLVEDDAGESSKLDLASIEPKGSA